MATVTNTKKDSSDSKSKGANADADINAMNGMEQSGASVDKIRDILFGSQIKNYESRFARVEEAVVRESADLKETMKRRFESLEGFFKRETESLAARLKAERDERTELLKGVARDLKASSDALTKKINDLDSKAAEEQSVLRKDLMTESRKLMEEIRSRNDSISAVLEARVSELRNSKTDRNTLSALLNEVANQLGDDPDQSKGGKTGKER